MELTPQHKESLKKVITCFKKAGADISTISDIDSDSVHVEFTIKVKGKEVNISVEFSTGDVYYEYFTSKNKIGNISSPTQLTDTIKKGIGDKEIAPNIDEESSTGTGASFSAGQGEQFATPFAFVRKKLKANEGKSLVGITKSILSEDVRFTKDKSKELLDKYEKDLEKYKSASKVLYGKFSSFSLGDLLEESNINDFKRVADAADKLFNKTDKDHLDVYDIGSNMYDEYDDNKDNEAYGLYKHANDISSKYQDLANGLEIIKDISDELVQQIDTLIEYKKLKHLKDFQQGIK